jgi:glycosyltransferase involved in cell wall biosynthesis
MTKNDSVDISVVMPCFNYASFIAEAIGSVFAQGIEKIQLIVVDDGSTDASADIALGLDRRVECIRQPNAGAAAARNTGIARARGKYLAFLDADDVWTPGSLAARLELLRAGQECVYGACQAFLSPEMPEAEARRFGALPPPMPGRLPGTVLLTRTAFDRVGLFDTSVKLGDMFDWFARAEVARLATASIDRIVLRRRIHGANISIRLKGDNREYLKALKASLHRRREASVGPGDPA